MARRRSGASGGLTPQGAVGTFLPMGIGFGMANVAMGQAGAGAASANAAGMPAAGALMGVAGMGVATQALGMTMGSMGKKRRR
jgi:hypothetical protein